MPTYASKCSKCGVEHEFVARIANRDETPECCGEKTTRMLTAPQIGAMSFTGHKGFVMHREDKTPMFIESGADYNKYLKDNNKIPWSEGKREAEIQAEARRKADDEHLTKVVTDAVNSHPELKNMY